jgi:hypothetical protein
MPRGGYPNVYIVEERWLGIFNMRVDDLFHAVGSRDTQWRGLPYGTIGLAAGVIDTFARDEAVLAFVLGYLLQL